MSLEFSSRSGGALLRDAHSGMSNLSTRLTSEQDAKLQRPLITALWFVRSTMALQGRQVSVIGIDLLKRR
jgi:hypothetical protein